MNVCEDIEDSYLVHAVRVPGDDGVEVEHTADTYEDAMIMARMTGGYVVQYGVFETERTRLPND